MSNTSTIKVIFPFLGILALIFISLKLALIFISLKLAGVGVVATWSWWLVLSPLWIPWVIVLFVLFVAFIIGYFVRKF